MPFSEQEVTRSPCYTDAEYIKLPRGVTRTVTLTIRTDTGEVKNIDSYKPDGFTDALTIKFIGKHTVGTDEKLWDLTGVIDDDPETGRVTFDLSPDDATKKPGLFIAHLAIYADEVLLDVIPYYVEITCNTLEQTDEPLTIAEVRLELRDTCPEANVLIDELEFTDAEIIWCIRKSIDEFNATPPVIGQVTVANFPHKSQLVKAAVGHLLTIAARSYARNTLKYSAGGMTIDDKNKQAEYMSLAQAALAEWKDWVQNFKISWNVGLCYGILGSRYRW